MPLPFARTTMSKHRSRCDHSDPGKQPQPGWRALPDFSDCLYRARHPNEVQRPAGCCLLTSSIDFTRLRSCVFAAEAFGTFRNGNFGVTADGRSDNGADFASVRSISSRQSFHGLPFGASVRLSWPMERSRPLWQMESSSPPGKRWMPPILP